jgi:16S rRNA (cytosine967-C5)-methyltransferase
MARDNEPAELALRANTLRTDAAALAAEIGVPSHRDRRIAEALVLEGPLDIHASPLWAEGAYTAQSRAAMLVAHVLAPEPGERLLDLCAAPGGKSTHLAALMEGRGEIVAVERNARRAHKLERTAKRLGAENIRVEIADAAEPREDGPFDRVLVDPPCSGLGTLQARPDRRWRAEAASTTEMSQSQSRILGVGADALRPGGVLVYSTCTVSPIENERLIADFLDSRPDFALDDLTAEWPEFALTGPALGGAPSGMLLTLPHRDDTAGFFIARLRRS